ncbi:ZP domain-containing protein [Aphelenchoides besseyi]|nr:ZP domain-containing protein [Aphelenchoides besseyi]KAI6193295.1 ZP domain-containing protein [Aphelenchoides besseyi]
MFILRFLAMLPLLATVAFAQLNSSSIIELPVSRFPDPDCSYKVLHNGPNGPVVTSRINLGDPIFHKWQCYFPQKGGADIYCMMVYSCTVASANHREPVEIIDEFGCPRDNIIPELEYMNDLSAGLRVSAFSLEYGEPAIHFRCSIRMLLKTKGFCRRPICPKQPPFQWR